MNDHAPGCVCAVIADVAGSRLTDRTIRALCDRLRGEDTDQ